MVKSFVRIRFLVAHSYSTCKRHRALLRVRARPYSPVVKSIWESDREKRNAEAAMGIQIAAKILRRRSERTLITTQVCTPSFIQACTRERMFETLLLVLVRKQYLENVALNRASKQCTVSFCVVSS